MIGADGLRSKVREELGIATEGSEGLAQRLVVLFRAPVWELVSEHRYGIYFLTDGPEGAVVPARRQAGPLGVRHGPGRWARPASRRSPTTQVKRWIRDAAGDPDLPIEIERSMPVAFGVGLAERFREGDAFLIGDAAHRVTPRGGTGLNTAIRDGFDIGWKLAWVLRGWGGERLLDSYERERRPVAEFNTRALDPRRRLDPRRAPSVSTPTSAVASPTSGCRATAALVSTLDLLDDGLTLFVGPDWDGSLPESTAQARRR